MAQHLEVYHVGDGAKTMGKGPKNFKNQKKGNVAQVEGSLSRGDRLGGLGREKIAAKEGQGRRGLKWKKDQEGRMKKFAMPQLWW